MIHIFFVPGMFGSTIEYVLRSFTNEYDGIEAEVLTDGSMHSFKTQNHLVNEKDFRNFFTNRNNENAITTPIYPFNNKHLPELLNICQPNIHNDDKCLLVYTDSLEYAEINMLCKYHKIAFGNRSNLGMNIFCGNNVHNIKQWNSQYTHWEQMQRWELREWLSLFYVEWSQEWIDSQYQVPAHFYKISTNSLLNDTYTTLSQIIKHCGLTRNDKDLEQFSIKWRNQQDYIWQEYQLTKKIVYCTIKNIDYSWCGLNIVAEAIIQQQLRVAGYHLRCDNLNELPENSLVLANLLNYEGKK
jgi:hypothetical protein